MAKRCLSYQKPTGRGVGTVVVFGVSLQLVFLLTVNETELSIYFYNVFTILFSILQMSHFHIRFKRIYAKSSHSKVQLDRSFSWVIDWLFGRLMAITDQNLTFTVASSKCLFCPDNSLKNPKIFEVTSHLRSWNKRVLFGKFCYGFIFLIIS